MRNTLPLLFPSVCWMEEIFFSWQFRAVVAGFYPAVVRRASGLLWHNNLYVGCTGTALHTGCLRLTQTSPGARCSHQLPAKTGVIRDQGTHHTSSIFVIKSTSSMTQTKRTIKNYIFVVVVPCLFPGTLLILFSLSKKSAFSVQSLNKMFQCCAELGCKHCREMFFKPDVKLFSFPLILFKLNFIDHW